MPYELEPLSPGELATWDERIADYESTQLFHRQGWLDYLASSRGLKIHQWAVRESGRTVGYFCAGSFKKGPFLILGSPLKGWATNFMGPVVNSDYDQDAFLSAVDELCAREGIAALEIENPLLSDEPMSSHGCEFVAQPTYIVELALDTDRMWRRIDLKSRQKVRKAQRAGLAAKECSDSSMTDEYFDQFVEVLARKGLSPPHDRNSPRLLFEHLYPKGLLFAVQILDPDGRPIASGLFPHDHKTIYYWGGASRMGGWSYSPNDLLQWTVMEWAAQHGLTVYNMCGYGYFKSKFGGVLQEPRRWQKYYSKIARWGRAAYGAYFQQRIRLMGNIERLRRSGKEREKEPV